MGWVSWKGWNGDEHTTSPERGKAEVARGRGARYTGAMNTPLTSASVAGMIDHALLSPTLTAAEFDRAVALDA